MTCTAIIITLNRPEYVRRCLQCLARQTPRLDQVIVVDSSPDTLTRAVVAEFAGVLYLRNEDGYGRMTTSRNIGLRHATGDIVAFLDDDAFAHDGWLAGLLAAYEDPKTGAVGGRALNNQPGEASFGAERIGKLMPNGDLLGHFAADPGRVIPVDHVMGCNMSFRRQVLAELGGFREDYGGISGICEDSDMCLRVRRAGHQILFTPHAVVDHVAAPQAKGRRFDARYVFWANRNRLLLLSRNFGMGSGIFWRYFNYSTLVLIVLPFIRSVARAAAMAIFGFAGNVVGLVLALRVTLTGDHTLARNDPDGREIRAALSRPEAGGIAARPHKPLPQHAAIDVGQEVGSVVGRSGVPA